MPELINSGQVEIWKSSKESQMESQMKKNLESRGREIGSFSRKKAEMSPRARFKAAKQGRRKSGNERAERKGRGRTVERKAREKENKLERSLIKSPAALGPANALLLGAGSGGGGFAVQV